MSPLRALRPSAYQLAPFLLVLLLGCQGSSEHPDGGPPYAPDAALATFELADGFRIDLVAAEPLVADPVAMEIDEYGRLYVAEMPGYPLDTGGSGRIRRLEDTDGDGRPDRGTVFADGLTLPTGLMRWKDGLLVTDAPDVFYLEDTDGDGRADRKEIILTGFARSNPQHNFNKPLYGLDNWIYLANNGPIWWTERYAEAFGGRGEAIRFTARPEAPALGRNALDRNLRFRPDTYEIETRSGNSQFGHTFDAWGHHFLLNNSHHHYHEVIAAPYLQRNPALAVRRATHDTPDHGAAAEVYPITANPEHQLLTDRGVFTSAAGLTHYLGGAFPEPYAEASFVAEPVHNLVHADRIVPDGATFSARRILEGREFLASTDSWFRPVNFYVGPDGALYVVDYYRQIVEHPEWMDEAAIASGNLQSGTDRGRIYRIAPAGLAASDWLDNVPLGDAEAEALVAALDHPNAWWRTTAQRLLVGRQDTAAAAPLVRMARESDRAEARLHALWTLDGLGRLTPGLVADALEDPAPGVRENALLMAETRMEEAPSLAEALLTLQHEPDARVRFQLLCTLGSLDTAPAQEARQELLFDHIEDPWMQLAALSAPATSHQDMFDEAVARLAPRATQGRAAYFRQLGALIGAGGQVEAAQAVLTRSLREGEAAWWRAPALEGLAEGLRRNEENRPALSTTRTRLLQSYLRQDDPALRKAYRELLGVLGLPEGTARRDALQQAATVAADARAGAALRADALHLITLAGPAPYLDLLKARIDPQEPAPVQRAALHALREVEGPAVGTFLLERWSSLTPDLRGDAVDVLMTEEPRVRLLLDAVEAGTVQRATLGWQRRVELMRDWEGDVRDRARALLREPDDARSQALTRYAAATDTPGDAEKGAAVFTRVCASCHQMGAAGGTPFGPDLATVRHWSRPALLEGILDPNRSIADGYELWFVERQDGEAVSGVIAEETPTSLTLRSPNGTEATLLRTDIAAITASDVSAMPSGLEEQLSEAEMADLLAFLKQN